MEFVCLKSSIDLKLINMTYSMLGLSSQTLQHIPHSFLGKLILYHSIPAAVDAWEVVQTE
jgi:hypothetical protein